MSIFGKLLSLLDSSRKHCRKNGYDQVMIVDNNNQGLEYCKQGIHLLQPIGKDRYQCIDCGYCEFTQSNTKYPTE